MTAVPDGPGRPDGPDGPHRSDGPDGPEAPNGPGSAAGRDPGRQPERTRLAWRRTVLTSTVVALLAVRMGGTDPVTAGRLLAAAGVLAVWLALLAVSWRRITAMTAVAPAPAGWAVPLTALATVGLGGVGLALVAAG